LKHLCRIYVPMRLFSCGGNNESLCRNIKCGMTIRRIFAGSIVAVLLLVPPLAAACDLTCAFPSMSADCHSQRTESQDTASGGMKMDGMAMAEMPMPEMGQGQQTESVATGAIAGHASIGEMGPCERQSCDNGVSVSARANRFGDLQFHFLVATDRTPRANGASNLIHDAQDDVARDRSHDASPLPLSLRI
jgi:hypothetical protein